MDEILDILRSTKKESDKIRILEGIVKNELSKEECVEYAKYLLKDYNEEK